MTTTRRRRTPPPRPDHTPATCGTCRTRYPTVEAFDAHLVGGPDGRRCPNPAALIETDAA